MKPRYIIATVFFTLICCCNVASAREQTVYFNDFQAAIQSEWSNVTTDITPFGERRFLGQFSNETVSLNLGNLPEHDTLSVEFDLFIIKTWDGNGADWEDADIWSLVCDGTPILQTTFSNNEGTPFWEQSYPSLYGSGSYNARTGSVENNTLGFIPPTSGYPWGIRDSVYHMSYKVAHSNILSTLSFDASQLQEIQDESWGLDNVNVSVSTVPEPSSVLSLMIGGGGLVWRRYRK